MNEHKKIEQRPAGLPILFAAAALAVLSIACGDGLSADAGAAGDADEASAASAASTASDLLAKVGDVEINAADVEEQMAAAFEELERRRHELLEQGLEQTVESKLLELEAESRDLTVEALLDEEITARSTAVTDEEVDAFYEQRKSQINQPKSQIADRIRQFLGQQRSGEARAALIEELRGRYKVKTFLEPMRIEVAAENAPFKGPADAPVTLVEFSDFECPYCSRVVPTLNQVTETYGDKVRLVFRQFPLHNLHPNAQKAAEASLCANDQDKFWEMHDAMFDKQRELSVDNLKTRAAELELDGEVFAECLDTNKYATKVAEDLAAGQRAGVSGTPAVFVNGRFVNGAQPFEVFAKLIDDELRRAAE